MKYRNEAPFERPSYAEKQFLHTLTAGAGLPFVQAAITAAVMMIAAAGVIFFFDGIDYLRPMIGVGAITFVIIWLMGWRRWLTLTDLERITGMDLDNNNKIGDRPITGSVHVQVDTLTPSGHIDASMMFDLPATPHQLKAYAHGVLHENKSPGETEWSPLKDGKPFSLDQIRALKAEMIKRGLLVQATTKGSNLGYIHTAVGIRVLQRIDDARIEDIEAAR